MPSSFAPAAAGEGGPSNVQLEGPFFPTVSKIQYNPNGKPDELCFKHYNANRVVLGKTMEEHLRFSLCYWHTWRGDGSDPFGEGTLVRAWDDGTDSLANALRRMKVHFEFLQKSGIGYWTFHDRDIAPEGATLEETNANLDVVVALAKKLQDETGIKCLWGTSNLFAQGKYMSGAATSPNAHAFVSAAAQVKKMLEVTKFLGGENFVFWGGREGYATLLNSDVKREIDHMAMFFKMACDYADKIGFTGQFLIEPKPKEPSGHQYDYDAQTVYGFLKTYGLENRFKVNIEPNHTQLAGHRFMHDVHVAAKLGFLGSIDANSGSEDLGWDTDEFIMDINHTTQMMLAVVGMGGIAPGGLNFDTKVRRESTDLEDLFWGHIGSMDCLALGLLNAAKIIEDGIIPGMIKERYSTFDSGIGAKIEKGQVTFEDCEDYMKKNFDVPMISSQEEKYKKIFNHYLVSKL